MESLVIDGIADDQIVHTGSGTYQCQQVGPVKEGNWHHRTPQRPCPYASNKSVN